MKINVNRRRAPEKRRETSFPSDKNQEHKRRTMSSHKHFFDVLLNRLRSLLSVSQQLSSYSDRKSSNAGNSREKIFLIGSFEVKRTKNISKYRLESCVFLSNSHLPLYPRRGISGNHLQVLHDY